MHSEENEQNKHVPQYTNFPLITSFEC